MTTLVVGPVGSGKSRFARELCLAGAWWLNLNPSAPLIGPLGCSELFGPGEKPRGFRFLGSLHLHRTPLQAMEAVKWAVRNAHGDDLAIELPFASIGALAVFVYRYICREIRPSKIVSMGVEYPETILAVNWKCDVETRVPEWTGEQRTASSIMAFRRAQVRNYFSAANDVSIAFREIAVLGSRFGSGLVLDTAELEDIRAIGIRDVEYAEIDGRTLYAVTSSESEPGTVTACADRFGCRGAHLVHPKTFVGLLVGLENSNGDHFAVGRILGANFAGGYFRVESPTEAPAPVSVLHMGLWRSDDDGNEIGELRPWQV